MMQMHERKFYENYKGITCARCHHAVKVNKITGEVFHYIKGKTTSFCYEDKCDCDYAVVEG